MSNPTPQQEYDVSTLAALAYVWTSYADEPGSAVAQTAVLRSFQQQYNARLATLRALQAGGEYMQYPLATLATDGRYGAATGRAMINVAFLTAGGLPWVGAFPARYDAARIGQIWEQIEQTFPVGDRRHVSRTMWAMLRNVIGAQPEQAGQIAVNTSYQLWSGSPGGASPSSYASVAPLVKATGQPVVLPSDGAEQWEVGEGDFATEDGYVLGRKQQSTSSLALIGVLVVAGVGIMVASAYKGRLA